MINGWIDVVSLVLMLGYVILLLTYLIGWLMIKKVVTNKEIKAANRFTILIPARNEERVILKCLQDIAKQQYPTALFEIIVIDDYSEDHTADVVKRFAQEQAVSIKLLQMKDVDLPIKYKKAAITFGVNQAQYEHIILTDADCERGDRWLCSIDQFISQSKAKMIYAPVVFKAKSVFEKIQSLEFAGLVGIGAAAIRLKNPNMCSAANLIFSKAAFYEVDGYANVAGIASGDDEFLLHKIFKRYPNEVYFLKNDEAIVYTSANTTINELASQRKRWVSKSTKYEDRFITLILAGAYLFNASVLLELFLNPQVGLLLLLSKTLVEGAFLFMVLRFFKRSTYLWFLPIAEIFHIIYVLIIGIWANLGTYQWKGRKLN